jgi:Protein of unknown function (DUF3775)
MPGLKFLTVEQVKELIDRLTTPATSSTAGTDATARVEDRVAELSADQQSELYALYWLGREPDARPKDLDRLTERARAFSSRAGSFPTRTQLASKLRKGLEKLGDSAAV